MPVDYPSGRLPDFLFLAASGYLNGVATLKKFGANPEVGTTEETIWDLGGKYNYPTVAAPLTVSSTDATDTAAGTGARTISISGLVDNSGSWDEFEVTVPMNGQTPVAVVPNCIRVFRAKVVTAGSAGRANGNIHVGTGTVTGGVPAQTLAYIANGYNQTLMAIYTVPSGKRCYIREFFVTSGKAQFVTVLSKARSFGEVFQTKRVVGILGGNFIFKNEIPFVFEAKTDIEISAFSDTAPVPIQAGFDMIIANAANYD